jgi:O-methyltransferase involved in polyketide biosynthesis
LPDPVTDTAVLPIGESTVAFLSGLLSGERARRGTRRGRRMLGCYRQAILVLRWFLDATRVAQFVDLGAGLPTVGAVHEAAARGGWSPPVVYVDHDEVAAGVMRQIVAEVDGVGVVCADLRNVSAVVTDPVFRALIDPAEPVALLAVAVLHFVEADDALVPWRQVLAPGSWLAVSHATVPRRLTARESDVLHTYQRGAASLTLRSLSAVEALFDGWELVEPGVVEVNQWRPDPDAPDGVPTPGWAGVARLPGGERSC